MKIAEPWSVFTNIVFLIPLYFSFKQGFYLYSFIILLVFIFSILFHLVKPPRLIWPRDFNGFNGKQKVLYVLDIVTAVTLTVFNIFRIIRNEFTMFSFFAIIIAVIATFLFFYPFKFKGSYDLSEGVWHVLSAIITMLVII